ncbi:hypothetical protein RhiirC2_793922 [Rhizophagus irregularis]|uniref:Uncharacterized protein n=1 Tax=Rhizophagus irregularis TaxID=588596 RepID=A0A2N1MEK3_9GLOM|nr:hypothetical protein RhiirC2_793922 [Rhizophagus irregularis]
MKNKTKIVLITWNDAQGFPIFGEDKNDRKVKKNEWIRKYNEEEKNNEKYNEKIGIIDSLVQSDDDFITILKNSIFEKDSIDRRKKKFYLTIDTIKTKSAVNKEEKRTYNYNVIWIINEIENYFLANEKNLLKNSNIDIIDYNDQGYKKVIEIKKKARGMLKDKNIVMTIVHKIEIIEEALLVNEYNLIWNKKIVMGGFRKWSKKVTDAIWKNEILNSEKLDDLFMYNFRKNLTGKQLWNLSAIELPTYDTLLKRNTNKIENDICKRHMNDKVEDWEHIWICEVNKSTIDEIAQESIYNFEKQLEDKNLQDEIKILRNYNFDFMRILEQTLIVLRGKSRIWEILRGVYNNNFNKLSNKREEKFVIKNLWNFVYEEFRQRIWIPRCDEIKEIERKEGIQKMDL